MSEWKVKVNETKEYELESKVNNWQINGKLKDIDLLDLGNGKYHLIHEGKSYNASLIELNKEEKKVTMKVNNHTYELELEDRFDQLLQQLGMDDLASAAVSLIKAPMPGLVLNVMVEVGQEVGKDESLLILEAMKMENVLKSPAEGKIKNISVNEKESVEKNQILIEFE